MLRVSAGLAVNPAFVAAIKYRERKREYTHEEVAFQIVVVLSSGSEVVAIDHSMSAESITKRVTALCAEWTALVHGHAPTESVLPK